jgi:hypothetical protein
VDVAVKELPIDVSAPGWRIGVRRMAGLCRINGRVSVDRLDPFTVSYLLRFRAVESGRSKLRPPPRSLAVTKEYS